MVRTDRKNRVPSYSDIVKFGNAIEAIFIYFENDLMCSCPNVEPLHLNNQLEKPI